MIVDTKLFSAEELKEKIILNRSDLDFVLQTREVLRRIFTREDKRFLIVVGPCSIHNYEGAMEYAKRLVELSDKVGHRYLIVMRTYIEKSRTSTGWKGYVYDPYLTGQQDLQSGLYESRRLLRDIIKLKLPVAMEILDPLIYSYFDDILSWGCIGARTSNSQIHRQFVSSLDYPIGFKNTPTGEKEVAIDAILTARQSHSFIGVNQDGTVSEKKTFGNPYSHIVLRGTKQGPNCSSEKVHSFFSLQLKRNIDAPILIDCSHANSNYMPEQQINNCKTILKYLDRCSDKIVGFMLESFLERGSQLFLEAQDLNKRLSVTDPCISWQDTVELLLK